MGKFAIVEDGKVVYRGALPKSWKSATVNVNNLHHIADDLESLAAKGIFPLEEVTPEYDPATHRPEGWTEDIQPDRVVLTYLIREKTIGELEQAALHKATEYCRKRESEYTLAGLTDKALLIALWERVVEDNPEPSNSLQVERAAIKAKHPKPK